MIFHFTAQLNDCDKLISLYSKLLANIPAVISIVNSITGFLIKSYLTYLLAPAEFIEITAVQEKLEFYLSNFRQTHNICLSLMSQFYMFINNGFFNTHLSLSQLYAIHKLVNSFQENISSLNDSVGELTLFLNNESYYWDFKTGLTLFTTLYKYIITFAEEVTLIITNNPVDTSLTSIIHHLSNPTALAITNDKLQLIDLIKTDLVVANDLIKNLTVAHENNVTTVIGNLITNLNFKFGNRLYNGFGFATNYQEILTVISGINDEYLYSLNTYIPCIAGLTDKLWCHMCVLYLSIYLPLLILIEILLIAWLFNFNFNFNFKNLYVRLIKFIRYIKKLSIKIKKIRKLCVIIWKAPHENENENRNETSG